MKHVALTSNRFEVLSELKVPWELWDTFKRKIFKAVEECMENVQNLGVKLLRERKGESYCGAGCGLCTIHNSISKD